MTILQTFVDEYKKSFSKDIQVKEVGLIAEIKEIKEELTHSKFLPSIQLKQILDKQIRRARYPMEVAIIGQFSSGKSTFLNALLSKDILPTGITPVTSKVNFLNYANKYKLKITYHSGAQEFMPIESISTFTDQREDQMDNIKYLTIYAPVEILKTISFVDTPGLNSLSKDDTNITKSILRDVGGIIWLTLLDNAGKHSELQILEEYMGQFKNKSLCVLNQKDKFTKEQIETSIKYIKTKFSKYFSQITPISAKYAVEARSQQKEVLLAQESDNFMSLINKNLKDPNYSKNSFIELLEKYENNIDTIKGNSSLQNEQKLEDSNINQVLQFIKEDLQPQAKQSKEFAIKKDLKNICDILINEYETISSVYTSLINTLENKEIEVVAELNNINKKYSNELLYINSLINEILNTIASEIYKNIISVSTIKYENKSSIFNKNKYKKIHYNAYGLAVDTINNKLFKSKKISTLNKKVLNDLQYININISNNYLGIYQDIYDKVTKWQKPFELIKKNREIGSDLEFSATRHFASKVYENVLKNYHELILSSVSNIKIGHTNLKTLLDNPYEQITNTTINSFRDKIDKSKEYHENNPLKFSLYIPYEEDILLELKANFKYELIEKLIISNRNYLSKIIKENIIQYKDINGHTLSFIKTKRDIYSCKIDDLKKIKDNIII